MRRSWFVAILLAACSESSPTTRPGTDGGADDDAGGMADGGGTEDQRAGPTYCSTLDPAPFLCVDFDDGVSPSDLFTKVEGATVEENALRAQSDGTTDAWVEHETDPSPQWSVVELGNGYRKERKHQNCGGRQRGTVRPRFSDFLCYAIERQHMTNPPSSMHYVDYVNIVQQQC
jgi:hypothetical protein